MRGRLHRLIFAGFAAGGALGVLLWTVEDRAAPAFQGLLWWLDLVGQTLFVGALKMIIAPLILSSIVAGVTSIPSLRDLGRIGWRTFAYYLATTAVAVAIGLALVHLVRPGEKPASVALREAREAELQRRREDFRAESGRDPLSPAARLEYRRWLHAREEASQAAGSAGPWEKVARAEGRTGAEIFRDDILRPLLSNPFEALADQVSLGIIFFSILFGVACASVGGPARPVVEVFQGAYRAMMRLTGWIMAFSPLAVACLVASLVARHGPEVFRSLGWYCATVIGGIVLHVGLLLLIAGWVGRTGPARLYRGVREAWLVAFTTRSSAATLPVTIENVTRRLGVSPPIANFVLPVGATVNMDGTALYEGVAVLYLLQIYANMDDVGIAVGGMTTLVIFVTAVLASVGAAAVPDAGLVTMVLVAGAVGLPVYYIPLLFAVDAFLDMFRTSTNVLGDVVGSTVLERLEGARLRAAERPWEG